MRAAGRLDRRDESGGRDEQRSADLLTELYVAHYTRSFAAVHRPLDGSLESRWLARHRAILGTAVGGTTVRGRTFRLG